MITRMLSFIGAAIFGIAVAVETKDSLSLIDDTDNANLEFSIYYRKQFIREHLDWSEEVFTEWVKNGLTDLGIIVEKLEN